MQEPSVHGLCMLVFVQEIVITLSAGPCALFNFSDLEFSPRTARTSQVPKDLSMGALPCAHTETLRINPRLVEVGFFRTALPAVGEMHGLAISSSCLHQMTLGWSCGGVWDFCQCNITQLCELNYWPCSFQGQWVCRVPSFLCLVHALLLFGPDESQPT